MCIRIFLWLLRSINIYRLYRMSHGHGMTWFMDVHGCSWFPNIGIPWGFSIGPCHPMTLDCSSCIGVGSWDPGQQSLPNFDPEPQSSFSASPTSLEHEEEPAVFEHFTSCNMIQTHSESHSKSTLYHLSGAVQVQPAAPTHSPSAETVQGLRMFHTRHMACFSASFHQASPYPSVLSLAALWAQTPGNICQWRQKIDIFILDE